MTKPSEVRDCLQAAGHDVAEDSISENQVQLRVAGVDAVVNVWASTGTCAVQGRDKDELEAILGDLVGKGRRSRSARARSRSDNGGPKKVFVVYGHDLAARTEIDAMLRRWGLEPLILDQLASHGNTIIEKLEHYQEGVEWAVVLLTPDDLGYPALDPSSSAPRPRQNVVLEMGMLLGKLGRERVAMIYKRSDPQMELPSDIQGYIYIPYDSSASEVGQSLAKEMAASGFYSVPVERI